mgnify:FL=1
MKVLNMIKYNYISPANEASIAKGIPVDFIELFKKQWPGKYRYRYRGPSTTEYDRSPYHCLAKYATSFAIYER